MQIKKNVENIQNRINTLLSEAKLASAPPKLIAVSKRQPQEKVLAALEAGHYMYGENRLQEALERWRPIKEATPQLELHFIGGLQSKKAQEAVEFFDAIHSLDRPSLAKALVKAMEKTGKRPACFIQINTGEEPQKSGVLPQDAPEFIRRCREEWQLPIAGLMCLPPQGVNPTPHFAFLRKLAQDHGLTGLSMGMSHDWELALRLGATHIRVGTAIFGEREG